MIAECRANWNILWPIQRIEVRETGIVPERHYARCGAVFWQEFFGPEVWITFFGCWARPCFDPITSKTVDKDDATVLLVEEKCCG